jgi:WD40 repeat protein
MLLEELVTIGGCNRCSSSLDFKGAVIAYACGMAVLQFDAHSHSFIRALRGHTDRVNAVRIIDDSSCVSGASDRTVRLWVNSTCIASQSLDASIVSLAVSEGRLAAIDISGSVGTWLLTAAGLTFEAKFKVKKSLPESLALSASGVLCVGSCDAQVYVYTLQEGSWVFNTALTGHKKTVTALSFNSRGDLLASSSLDTSARVWRLYEAIPEDILEQQGHFPLLSLGKSFKVDALLTSHTGSVSSIRWTGEQLITASHDCSVILWETDRRTGVWLPQTVLGQLGGCRHTFYAVVASDTDIVANSYNGTVFHWTRTDADWRLTPAISGHIGPVTDVAVGDGFIVTASQDQTARLFALCRGQWQEFSRPLVHGHDLNCVSLTPYNLITGGDEKVLRLFEPSNVTVQILAKLTEAHLAGQLPETASLSPGEGVQGAKMGAVQALGLSNKPSDAYIEVPDEPPNEDFLSSSTLWPEVFKLYGHGYEVSAVATHHPLLASACTARSIDEAEILIWNIQDRRKCQSLACHSLTVTQLAFSPNGLQLLSVSRARSWGLHTLQADHKWTTAMLASAHDRMIYSCSWLDDSVFMTTSRDKFAKVWSTDSTMLAAVRLKRQVMSGVFLSSDLLLFGLDDGSLVTHSLGSSEQTSVKVSSGAVRRIVLDAKRLYVASEDNTLTILKRS